MMEAPEIPQGWRIVEYLKATGRLTTIEGRRNLGIMNVSQRVSELRNKYGLPIQTSWVYEPDETGAVHRVACYLWKGGNSRQLDLWEGC